MVDADVASDRIGPRRESGFMLEISGVLYDPHENILNEILGRRRASHLAHDEIVERRFVAANEPLEGASVPTLEPHHQDLVRHLLSACGNHFHGSPPWAVRHTTPKGRTDRNE